MFSHTSARGKILLIVYIDDIIITGDDKKGIDDLKRYLQNSFRTKDLGKLRYFLGIEVAQFKEGISLSQRKYVLDILEETGLLGSKPMKTLLDPNVELYEDQGGLLSNPKRYCHLVWKDRPLLLMILILREFIYLAPLLGNWLETWISLGVTLKTGCYNCMMGSS